MPDDVSQATDRYLLISLRRPKNTNDNNGLQEHQDRQRELWPKRFDQWFGRVSNVLKTRAAY